jgi:hypothetical protein
MGALISRPMGEQKHAELEALESSPQVRICACRYPTGNCSRNSMFINNLYPVQWRNVAVPRFHCKMSGTGKLDWT